MMQAFQRFELGGLPLRSFGYTAIKRSKRSSIACRKTKIEAICAILWSNGGPDSSYVDCSAKPRASPKISQLVAPEFFPPSKNVQPVCRQISHGGRSDYLRASLGHRSKPPAICVLGARSKCCASFLALDAATPRKLSSVSTGVGGATSTRLRPSLLAS